MFVFAPCKSIGGSDHLYITVLHKNISRLPSCLDTTVYSILRWNGPGKTGVLRIVKQQRDIIYINSTFILRLC